MKLLPLVLILTALASAAFAEVTITPKKQTYRRPKPLADHKKTFTVTWPKVKASSPSLARRIEAALSYEKAFDFTIREELREIQWLETADFNVVYNKGNVLCVSLFIEGSGAYPSGSTKYVVVDTRTGVKQTSRMVFTNLTGLVAMIRKDQEKEVGEAIVEIRKDPEMREPDPSTLFTDKKFAVEDLKHFSVDGNGVTFHYSYGFPHVIQALEPVGEFRYTWAQMKPYIKKDGLLASMAR